MAFLLGPVTRGGGKDLSTGHSLRGKKQSKDERSAVGPAVGKRRLVTSALV